MLEGSLCLGSVRNHIIYQQPRSLPDPASVNKAMEPFLNDDFFADSSLPSMVEDDVQFDNLPMFDPLLPKQQHLPGAPDQAVPHEHVIQQDWVASADLSTISGHLGSWTFGSG